MFTFFLKKNFADGWDNLFFLGASNLFVIALGAILAIVIRPLFALGTIFLTAGIVVFCALIFVELFAFGSNAAKIAQFDSPSIFSFLKSFHYAWKPGFLCGVVFAISILILRVGFSFYLARFLENGSFVWLLLLASLGWATLIALIALQWFIPLYFLQTENTLFKCLKKSFIIFFDNPSFSAGVFLYNLILFALSVCLFLLIPGLNGILLSSTNALRLRLYKYDWIDEHPEALSDRDKRADVPWNDLLENDRQALGPRKLSSFIFPWK